MKSKIIFCLLAFFALMGVYSCSDNNVSDLQLNGQCNVNNIAIDNFTGVSDLATRTITVRVPETYDVTNMKVTALDLSEGATGSFVVGTQLNMSAPQILNVKNGDVFLNWTIKVERDEAKITSFRLNGTYNGVIDEVNKTIQVYVPAGVDVTSLTPTITYSKNATISPESGVATNFKSPVIYTVTNNTASATYTVTVTQINKPKVIFVGLVSSMDALNIEEKTACRWMLQNVPNSIYASFDDVQNGSVDLSECKVIWWHYHKDGGVDGKNAFESSAPQALNAVVPLRNYYNNGGSFLFTRYATNMPAELGAVTNDAVPNNCWGQNEDNAETVSSPWSFSIQGHTAHPLFQNLTMKQGEETNVYTCDAGYRITNSTAQFHIGADWGGYADYNTWRTQTGGIDLAYGGDGTIVAWEFPKNGTKGDILCIGSGCYDWYSIDDVTPFYHNNVAQLTLNAINYLINE